MIKITKNEIIKYGLIASLFANFTIGTRYVVDGKEYHEKIKNLDLSYHDLDQKYKHTIELAKEINDISLKKSDTIIKLTDELEKVKNENNKVKKDNKLIHNKNEKLKKYIQRKGVINKQRKLNMTATAYVSNCIGCSGLTVTEYNVRNTIYYQGYRIVAADLNILPLYSIIEIETKTSKFKAIVIDKGGLIRGGLLDLLVGSYEDATRFGRQNVKVKVIRLGKG